MLRQISNRSRNYTTRTETRCVDVEGSNSRKKHIAFEQICLEMFKSRKANISKMLERAGGTRRSVYFFFEKLEYMGSISIKNMR